MGDEFGTVSARQAARIREIELLRKHRESLVKMLADVDAQLRELDPGSMTQPTIPNPSVIPPSVPRSEPGTRPLVTSNVDYEEPVQAQPGGGMRVLLILGAALVALVLIAWLVWRASSDRKPGRIVEERPNIDTTATASATVAETAPPETIETMSVRPPSQDYGLIRKGTRATRQYEVTNNTDEPITITVSRSACRCLYYEHAPVVAPKGKESITVTVDGAKAKAGTIRETIKVSSKSAPGTGTSFDVIATVR